MADEMEFKNEKTESQICLLIWKKYISFENLQRKPGDDLASFIGKWQKMRQGAESVGCHYSESVLACKLIEKANLSEDAILTLLSEVEPMIVGGGSLFNEILARFQNNSYRYTLPELVAPANGEGDAFDIKVPCEDDYDDGSGAFGDDFPDDNGFDLDTMESMKSNLEDSKPPLKTCPQCSNLLSSENDNSHFGNLEIVTCDVCNVQLFAKFILDKKQELTWEYLILPKCHKCAKFLDLNANNDADFEDFNLRCRNCDVTVDSIMMGDKMVTLKTAMKKKDWNKKWKKKRSYERRDKTMKLPKEEKRKAQLGDYQCEICGKPFYRLHNMQKHVKSHSAAKKQHKCEFCHKTFSTVFRLKTHVNVHTGEKVYICNFCGKKFTRQSTFTEHLNIHTKAKTYDCKDCDSSFVHRNSLLYHIRVHHTGEKPYKCDQCEWCFHRSYQLTEHKRTHTGERPYKCKFCDKAFRVKTHLNRHTLKYCRGANPDRDVKPAVNKPAPVAPPPIGLPRPDAFNN